MKNTVTGPWKRQRAWLFDCAPDLILLAALTTLVGVFLYDYVKRHDEGRPQVRSHAIKPTESAR